MTHSVSRSLESTLINIDINTFHFFLVIQLVVSNSCRKKTPRRQKKKQKKRQRRKGVPCVALLLYLRDLGFPQNPRN